MGRPSDNPRDQAAKGFPNKRKTKTEKAIEQADRLAKLLGDAPAASQDYLAPPALIADPRLKAAATVWAEYAPRLYELHLLARLDRHTFALFCIYVAEFAAANEDIIEKGYSVAVKTVSGDKMLRKNPSVDRRDHAANMVMHLSEKFGLTPADRSKLIRDQAMRLDENTLFGTTRQPAQPAAPAAEAAPIEPPAPIGDGSVIGTLSQFDSLPPGGKPN